MYDRTQLFVMLQLPDIAAKLETVLDSIAQFAMGQSLDKFGAVTAYAVTEMIRH